MGMRIWLFLWIVSLGLSTGSLAQQIARECPGRFRWDVKTLTDSSGPAVIRAEVLQSSVAELALAKPAVKFCILRKKHNHWPRLEDEKKLVKVRAFVTKYNTQHDQDFHILIRSEDEKYKMVVEIPDPECQIFASSPELKAVFTKARKEFAEVQKMLDETGKPVLVEITGVPFWDARHWWLKGTAPNGREIHPVIAVQIISR